MNDVYRWRGGCENLRRLGNGAPITLLVLPALFEEANRMRRFTVTVMRLLAKQNIATILPDLPGTGESETALCETSFADWADAVATLASGIFGSIAFRGGALLDGSCKHQWQLAPDTGERLLRDLVRATAFTSGISVAELDRRARTQTTRLAGNLMAPQMYISIHNSTPVAGAHVSKVVGQKLWRATEPTEDPAFAQYVADDIVAWIKSCAAS